MIEALWTSLGGAPGEADAVAFTGSGVLPSCFPVAGLAAASFACAGLAVAGIVGQAAGRDIAELVVDRRLASFWFGLSIRPSGWALPPPWDAVAGDYRARDGWIRLHTNAPRHREAALRVLGLAGRPAARHDVAAALAQWDATALESAIVDAGGCAAAMHDRDAWARHPQGAAVSREPIASVAFHEPGPGRPARVDPARPLAGVRVLDLTRVLAGPIATRFLAAYGADVLRIDPPGWDEPGVIPEVTPGKRCAGLDLAREDDRRRFEALLREADVLVHGYRPDALERRGVGAAWRRSVAPALVEVTLDAYGWSGPWAGRRGFDSLVQMSSGIAEAGMRWRGADKPVPLPVQALDHATGYLMAAAAVRAWRARRLDGRASSTRLSLARTAAFLADAPPAGDEAPLSPPSAEDLDDAVEHTAWGDARRLRWPIAMAGTRARFDRPAGALRSAPAAWLPT